MRLTPTAIGAVVLSVVTTLLGVLTSGGLTTLGGGAAQAQILQTRDAERFSPASGGFTPKTLKVVTIARPPFVIKTDTGLAGFSIDLWNELAREIGRESEFRVATKFPQMLQEVEDRRADVAIANITITSAREKVLDFTQPMFDAGLKVMVAADGQSVGLIGALFNLEMLGLVLLAGFILLCVANLMWFFEHKDQPYFQYPYKEGIFRSFWWALNVTVNGGFEERVPLTPAGRIFGVFLVVASLFIVSAFVAKITATLTVGELKTQIQGYTDLYGKRVGTTRGSTASAFLSSHSIKHVRYDGTKALFRALVAKKLDAVVHDAPLLDYFAITRGRGKVRVVGDLLRPEKYGIALQVGSDLREPLNRALLRLRENGSFARLRARWFNGG